MRLRAAEYRAHDGHKHALIELASKPALDSQVRVDAAISLARSGYPDDAVVALHGVIYARRSSRAAHLQAGIALAEMELWSESAHVIQGALMPWRTDDLRDKAARALVKAAKLGHRHDDLLTMASNRYLPSWVRVLAAEALVEIGFGAKVRDSLTGLVGDTRANIDDRAHAASLLAEIGGPLDIPTLVALVLGRRLDLSDARLALYGLHHLRAEKELAALASNWALPVDTRGKAAEAGGKSRRGRYFRSSSC